MNAYTGGQIIGNLMLLVFALLILISVVNWNRSSSKFKIKNVTARVLASIFGTIVGVSIILGFIGNLVVPKDKVTTKSTPWSEQDRIDYIQGCSKPIEGVTAE